MADIFALAAQRLEPVAGGDLGGPAPGGASRASQAEPGSMPRRRGDAPPASRRSRPGSCRPSAEGKGRRRDGPRLPARRAGRRSMTPRYPGRPSPGHRRRRASSSGPAVRRQHTSRDCRDFVRGTAPICGGQWTARRHRRGASREGERQRRMRHVAARMLSGHAVDSGMVAAPRRPRPWPEVCSRAGRASGGASPAKASLYSTTGPTAPTARPNRSRSSRSSTTASSAPGSCRPAVRTHSTSFSMYSHGS